MARAIVVASDLFPLELLDGLIEPFFDGDPGSGAWLVAENPESGTAGGVAGVAWVRPEPLTERAWNLVALGVHPSARRSGAATTLIAAVEEHVALQDGSPLVVETSSLPAFEGARALYASLGYERVAEIADYWTADDAKVVYLLRLPR